MDKRTLLFMASLAVAFFCIQMGFEYYGSTHRTVVQQPQAIEEPQQEVEYVAREALPAPSEEQHYVLANSYQQIVFSSVGGAIVEINLPFQSATDTKSPVRSIAVDRTIDGMFPLQPALQADGGTLKPSRGGFYPLLRRTETYPPQDRCMAVVNDSDLARLPYRVTRFTSRSITFEGEQANRRITKTYTLPEHPNTLPYCLTLDIRIDGDTRGLSLTSGLLDVEWMSSGPAPQVQYFTRKGETTAIKAIDLPKERFTTSLAPQWVCESNGFFGLIMDPIPGPIDGFVVDRVAGTEVPSRLTLLDPSRYKASELPAYETRLPLRGARSSLRLYAGPLASSIFSTVDATYAAQGTPADYSEALTNYGWFAFISEPFAKFLFWIMRGSYAVCPSWVVAILVVTIILRLLLYPLNRWSMTSMKRMQQIAPEVKSIQERYKKEPLRAQQEVMALYKQYGVNPASGCLPLLLQMPFLIGMFDLLKSRFELRGTPFIPGWIPDLAAPDVVCSWGFHIPLIGNQLHILPLLLGVTMWIQQNMSANLPADRSTWTDQQRQQRAMSTIMTAVMTILFYDFPSGLNIYWMFSMLLGVAQQWWTNKRLSKAGVLVTIEAAPHRKHR